MVEAGQTSPRVGEPSRRDGPRPPAGGGRGRTAGPASRCGLAMRRSQVADLSADASAWAAARSVAIAGRGSRRRDGSRPPRPAGSSSPATRRCRRRGRASGGPGATRWPSGGWKRVVVRRERRRQRRGWPDGARRLVEVVPPQLQQTSGRVDDPELDRPSLAEGDRQDGRPGLRSRRITVARLESAQRSSSDRFRHRPRRVGACSSARSSSAVLVDVAEVAAGVALRPASRGATRAAPSCLQADHRRSAWYWAKDRLSRWWASSGA